MLYRCPIRKDIPPFVSLLRTLAPLCGVTGELPSNEEFAVVGFRAIVGEDPSFRLSHRKGIADPYGGGNEREQCSELQRAQDSDVDTRRLRIMLAEVAWVGPELSITCAGPVEWQNAVLRAIEAYAGDKREAT